MYNWTHFNIFFVKRLLLTAHTQFITFTNLMKNVIYSLALKYKITLLLNIYKYNNNILRYNSFLKLVLGRYNKVWYYKIKSTLFQCWHEAFCHFLSRRAVLYGKGLLWRLALSLKVIRDIVVEVHWWVRVKVPFSWKE